MEKTLVIAVLHATDALKFMGCPFLATVYIARSISITSIFTALILLVLCPPLSISYIWVFLSHFNTNQKEKVKKEKRKTLKEKDE